LSVLGKEWTASQGELLMSDSENEDLLSAARRAEQQGGNPLFQVIPERVFRPRSWRDATTMQIDVHFRLEQLRSANGEVLGEAVSEAFMQGIRQVILRENIQNAREYSLFINVHHSVGTHVLDRSNQFPLTEWLEGSQRTRAWLDKLTKKLNSSEGFDAALGDFFADFTFIRDQARGSGCRGRKANPGNLSYEQLLKKKQCIVQIKNKDELCAARAIVTTKAHSNEDRQCKDISQGHGLQGHLAHQLQQQAGVPEGPCGFQAMKQFQDFMAPTCQIIVFEGQQGLLWFKDRDLNDAPKKIVLLKVQQHFHAVTSIPALLNRSYYCHHCEKAYSNETADAHNCQGQNCRACWRKKTCPNFAMFVDPQVYCKDCNRKFYGQDCYAAHKCRKTENSMSVCQRLVKCPECCKEYKPNRKKKHECGVHYYRNCDADVLPDHPCYIQPIANEKEKKDGLRRTAESEEEEMMLEFEEEETGEGDGGSDEKAPPIVCH